VIIIASVNMPLSAAFRLWLIVSGPMGLIAVLAARTNFFPRRQRAEIEADERGISEGGELVLARADIVDAFVTTRGTERILRFTNKLRFPLLDVAVESLAEGNTLLAAMKLDVLHKSFAVNAMAKIDYLNLPVRVTVGADGVMVKPIGGFIAYREIAELTVDDAIIVIRRRGASELRLYPQQHRDALFSRIREGMAAHERGEETGDAAALVARSGRSVDEWIRGLRALAADSHYRSSAVPPATLWRIP
jgi:hypothetical protein